MRFWLGLAIGLVLGAAGTYLAVERPWRSGDADPAPVATAAEPGPDAGTTPRKKGRKKAGGRPGGAAGADETYELEPEIELTAADRALEWRGDAVALPPARVDLGADDGGRALEQDEIQQGIAGGSGAMIDCIKDAAGGAPLSAEVTVQMLVGGDGRATKVRVRAPAYLHAHGLLACARRAARGFPFPATGAPTVVTAPFHLN